ncbi:MAG: hypothetical protein ACTHMX_14975, partial [Thermomicrobiales bacterium]
PFPGIDIWRTHRDAWGTSKEMDAMVAKQRDDDHESGTTRTTLTLGNDALRLIRRRAEASGQTLGEVATALILEAGERTASEDEESLPPYVFPPSDEDDDDEPVPGEYYNGILLIPKRGTRRPVTLELVQELMDEFP